MTERISPFMAPCHHCDLCVCMQRSHSIFVPGLMTSLSTTKVSLKLFSHTFVTRPNISKRQIHMLCIIHTLSYKRKDDLDPVTIETPNEIMSIDVGVCEPDRLIYMHNSSDSLFVMNENFQCLMRIEKETQTSLAFCWFCTC